MLVSGRVESIIYGKQWDFRLDRTDALPFDVRSPLPKSTLQPLAALVLFGDNYCQRGRSTYTNEVRYRYLKNESHKHVSWYDVI